MAICWARGSRSKIRKLWNHTPSEIAISNAISMKVRQNSEPNTLISRRRNAAGRGMRKSDAEEKGCSGAYLAPSGMNT